MQLILKRMNTRTAPQNALLYQNAMMAYCVHYSKNELIDIKKTLYFKLFFCNDQIQNLNHPKQAFAFNFILQISILFNALAQLRINRFLVIFNVK